MDAGTKWMYTALPTGSASQDIHFILTQSGKTPMKPARHLLLEESGNCAMLYRYAENWDFAGDTWHETRQDALSQVEFEYGSHALMWLDITKHEATARMTKWREGHDV